MRYSDLKRKILYQLLYCHVFISILLFIYISFIKEDSLDVYSDKEALRLGLAAVPIILTHVPWSAMRWGTVAKSMAKSNLEYDLLSILIDSAFAISVLVSIGFIFYLFEIIFFLFCIVAVIILFMVLSVKALFYSLNS